MPAQLVAQQPIAGAGIVVASISYRMIERPAEAPGSFAASSEADLQFLAITTIDGVTNTAALVQPRGRTVADTTLLIHVHGSGGNYYGLPHGAQLMPLGEAGYASLSINTRQHDQAVNTDNFLEVRNDLHAATVVARSLGYQRIVLHGQSVGTAQVMYYAATDWSADLKGMILTGPFANLPWKTQMVLVHDDPLYRQLYQEALAAVQSGHPEAILPTEMPYPVGGRNLSPVTAQHFLTYRWQYGASASSVEWIKRVPGPILIVRDASDQTILPFEPQELYAAATDNGALSTDVESVLIPDSNSANGHQFPNTISELNELTLKWLRERGL
jgi:dienelactone hydrolase